MRAGKRAGNGAHAAHNGHACNTVCRIACCMCERGRMHAQLFSSMISCRDSGSWHLRGGVGTVAQSMRRPPITQCPRKVPSPLGFVLGIPTSSSCQLCTAKQTVHSGVHRGTAAHLENRCKTSTRHERCCQRAAATTTCANHKHAPNNQGGLMHMHAWAIQPKP